ncbi:MAG: DUF2141 domain-containing protein [Thermoanaerobaculales bacterium]|jgi:uncharacterized protein (DUF2141 family)|nr:DUF2141 domain-containing protein [Thermoanaerobaculales bacterium]
MPSLLKRIAFVLGAVALGSCASAPPQTTEPRPEGRGRLEISMVGFENEEGQVLVAVFLDSGGWPDETGSAFASEVVDITGDEASAVFTGVPAGPFAVSVVHDADSDRELDSGALGIPSEAYGFSADARSAFGPPEFDEARLELASGETKQITIRVK